jgi:hypothetical protein
VNREVQFAVKPGTEPSLEAAFQSYRKACYGDAAIPERQEFETRQAFIAGIVWLFGFMQTVPETEEGMKKLDALEADIQAFGETLRATAKAWAHPEE